MNTKKIVLLGGGSQAKVVSDIIKKRKELEKEQLEVIGILDDDSSNLGFSNIPILGKINFIEELVSQYDDIYFIITIANNKIRHEIVEKYKKLNLKYYTAIHPSATIASNVNIGAGTVVMAGAVVGPFTEIGNHVILNTLSSVDHDNIIEDFVHICPGAKCAGCVTVKSSSFICTGSSIIPGVIIGESTIVGAGSVVIKDTKGYSTVVGVPAKVIKFHDNE